MNTTNPIHRFVWPLLNLLAFLTTLTVNYLANALPLNGKDTGTVSDQYPNLFTPAPLTFSIWGVIYLGLTAFVVWQLSAISDRTGARPASVAVRTLGGLFIANCLLNAGWIFAFHFDRIGLSVVIILGMLWTLTAITRRVFRALPNSTANRWLLRAPFGIYLGWISIATIADITAFLVHLRWDGFGIWPLFWLLLVFFTGTAIAVAAVWMDNNVFYGFAVTWAFAGIVLRHYNDSDPSYLIMTTATLCGLIVLVGSMFRLPTFLQPAPQEDISPHSFPGEHSSTG